MFAKVKFALVKNVNKWFLKDLASDHAKPVSCLRQERCAKILSRWIRAERNS